MKIKAIIFDYWDTIANSTFNKRTLHKANKIAYAYVKKQGYKLKFEQFEELRSKGYKKYRDWVKENKKELTPINSFRNIVFNKLDLTEKDLQKLIHIYCKYDHKTIFPSGLINTEVL